MLVTNVSLHPPRSAPLVVEIIETNTIRETLVTQGAILAGLVDEPVAADDVLYCDVGDIMLEAASADADATVTGEFSVLVDEAATAAEAWSGSQPLSTSSMDEAATADSTQDATAIGAVKLTALVAGDLSVVFVTPEPSSVAVVATGTLLTTQ